MSVLFRSLLLVSASSVLCFADITLHAVNTNFPNKSSDGTAVFGSAALYGIQDFTLSDVGPAWTLTIDTDYGIPIGGNTGAIAGFCDGGGTFPSCALPFIMSDFLIQQGTNHYGIVLSAHDGLFSPDSYTPGDLYSATNFVNSPVFGKGPVILGTKISQLNTGAAPTETVTANVGCNGLNCASFKVVDSFTAPANFLQTSGLPITLIASSADCFNEFIMVTTPEPSGLVWLVPGLLLLGAYLRRRSLGRVN